MRRTFSRFLCATTPVAKVITLAQVGGAGPKSHVDIETLTKAKITDLACWKNLPQAARAALQLSRVAADALDEAAATAFANAARPVWIAFGSQTGTAESYARMLGTYAASHGFCPRVLSLDECAAQLASSPVSGFPDAILFVCSTYGTGEFPSNAKLFWKELCDGNLAALSAIPHAIFGLGNSHNEHFNAAAKSLAKKMASIGSPSLMRMQMSCELQQNGHDASFRTWKRAIWAALGSSSESVTLKPTYNVSECLTARADPHVLRHGFIEATVHQNNMMTPRDYTPRVRLLRVSMDCEQQRRTFGRVGTISDHIEIYPRNSQALVARALKRLGLSPSTIVEMTPLAGASSNPAYDFKKLTIETVLSEVVDLSAIPTRSTLETLSMCAATAEERERLENIAGDLSPGGLYDQLVAGVFTIVDALEEFPSVRLTLAQALTVLPHIAVRSYSIASDNTDGNHASFEILYNIPTRTSSKGQHHQGLCSSMLDRSEPGDRLAVRLVPSNVALPRDDAPCVVVALGTGIGSAHAILQHRFRLHKAGKTIGRTHLFYGMRHLDKDCFFREDFDEMRNAGFLTTTIVPSHDGPKFETPMDRFDASLLELLGPEGHIAYCGLGGSVPLVLENALLRVGLDVTKLRADGRLHEEFFSVDLDAENLFKSSTTDAAASTLAGRMGKCEMFCFQCEQTFKGTGCNKVGVCGKTPRVAALQDLTIHGAKHLGFYANEIRKLGGTVPDKANRFLLYAMFSTLTNVNFDEARFHEIVKELGAIVQEVRVQYEEMIVGKAASMSPSIRPFPSSLPVTADGLVALGKEVGVLTRFTDAATQNAAGVTEMLVYGLKGIAAYADHGLMNNVESQEIYAFMQKALAFLASREQYDLNRGLELCLEAGSINVNTMAMLYQSNASLGVPTPTPVAVKPTPGKAILVSGHDLIILKGLLEKTEKLGINVYTHGEMLPGHAYPKLKEHKNLVGHFGGAWMRQSVEFPHFPGPVLMTTNCITEPHETYKARLFTAGAVGWAGIPHIGNNMTDIDFEPLINAALNESKGFGSEQDFSYADPIGTTRPKSLTVGFGHETILSVAPAILEEIKKGTITRFFVVGGCDGYEGDRSYFTDLVARLPDTAVVLTVGCGKYRFNFMDKGTIGDTGIPRILDMGQCNDSYSAVQVALALAKALNCNVADLPLSIVLSWFEQKAIAVLLSCLSLGLKPIHVGPALPAFITPDVLQVLVSKFGIQALGDVNEDLKKMLAAPGAS